MSPAEYEGSPVPPFAIAAMPVMLEAVPPMLSVGVGTQVFAPERNARMEEAAVMVMSAVPLKEVPLMVRAVSSAVAVPALPPMLRVVVETHVGMPERYPSMLPPVVAVVVASD